MKKKKKSNKVAELFFIAKKPGAQNNTTFEDWKQSWLLYKTYI